ncbi:MAG TPA: hypothetical protein VJZ94_01510, partial [Candidatus Paceibacterota bacterium]|nr:hypothetical protein [Candidatus Paceibacterota bacterium]
RKPLSTIHFRRLEPQDQVAAKTMERPQLILELRFNRAYQQRERRAYRFWAPVTGGKKHYTKTPLRKDFPLMIDCRDPSIVYCC